jgi:hypothetical protein
MNSELIRLTLIVCSIAVVSQADEPSASPSSSRSPSLSASPAASLFEEPPTLNPSEILKPEFLSGPHFKVHDEVTTYSGGTHYLIDSDFGPFDAESNEMLRIRISEIDAIAKLQEVSNEKLGGVARITSFQRLPCCVTKDNIFVVAIQYDYLAWTEQVATAAEKVLNLKNGKESYAAFVLFTSGDLSPRAREELTQRGIKIYDRQLPGPLR